MSGAGDGATGRLLRVLIGETRPATDELDLWVLWAALGLGLVVVLVIVALLEWSSALARRRDQRDETLGAAAARIGQAVTADTAVGSLIASPRRGANPSAAVLLSSSPPPERLLNPPPG